MQVSYGLQIVSKCYVLDMTSGSWVLGDRGCCPAFYELTSLDDLERDYGVVIDNMTVTTRPWFVPVSSMCAAPKPSAKAQAADPAAHKGCVRCYKAWPHARAMEMDVLAEGNH